jgi:SAM-dependent methyltransferase
MGQKKKWNSVYRGERDIRDFYQFKESQLIDILSNFPNAKRVLDIGCGRGELLAQLEKRGFHGLGVDLSDIALKEAEKNTRDIQIIQADVEDYVFDPKIDKFDIVFLKLVLAFIDNKASLFEKIISLLAKNGGLILLTPTTTNKDNLSKKEIFVKQSELNILVSKYFLDVKETILYQEKSEKLSLFVLRSPNLHR